ncbi:MAG TPA: PAS domain-containing protein, partial [Candidatus Dormibacteraeota bacterium]|nr:PAS domain-containing protein [Candidatus Dormibacteraeota bacterium]
MSVAPNPATGSRPPPAPLRRAPAGVATVPWRERAFWVTQLLVAAVVGVHLAADAYGKEIPSAATAVAPLLTVIPVGYAAVRFGLRGSLPTVLWASALLVPDFIAWHRGLERWSDGTVLALLVIVAVATGRMVDVRRASAVALVAAERLRGIARVADQLPEGVCLIDLGRVITYANPAWAALQGLASPAAALGRTLESVHGEEHAHEESLPYHRPLDGGQPLRQLVQHRPPGRAPYWADVTVAALVDERGALIGRLCTVRDVTAEREAA